MIINKKGQISRVVFIFCIIIFYSTMFVFYSAYGSTKAKLQQQNIIYPDGSIASGGQTNLLNSSASSNTNTGMSIGQFGKYVVTGFKESPLWLNIIFFIPLVSLFAYLIFVAFAPFIDAGN
jgi:hypothetical protein